MFECDRTTVIVISVAIKHDWSWMDVILSN